MQAVGADKAAATAKATQELQALKTELQARELQLESTQASLAEQNGLHEQHVQALQARIEGIGTAAKKEAGKLQTEVESVTKKLDQLKKVKQPSLALRLLDIAMQACG